MFVLNLLFFIFSKVVPYLFGENCNETNQRIVTKLKEVRHEAHIDQNIRLQETIILTLAQFGRYQLF